MEQLNKLIDHTLLKPEATELDIINLCAEAKKHDFMSVCVNPSWVNKSSELLANSEVKVCTVIGFPLGANTTETKVFEAKNAIQHGAEEIDMVINIGKLKSKKYDEVFKDIKEVVEESHPEAIVKVIIETSLLTKEEITKVCELSLKANADFVKTSTGFSTSGADPEDVELMRKVVGNKIGVKASGGISTLIDAKKMINAGANRLGTSKGISIINK